MTMSDIADAETKNEEGGEMKQSEKPTTPSFKNMPSFGRKKGCDELLDLNECVKRFKCSNSEVIVLPNIN